MSQSSSIADPVLPKSRQAAGERRLLGANIRRLMARLDMTLVQAVAATGLDERTLRSLIRGEARPQARTLHKLAAGLGVEADELFRDCLVPTAESLSLDRAANPAVAEVIASTPELFRGWTEGDFAELSSRVAVGGQLTPAGAVAAAETMNRRRTLLAQVSLILETNEADLLEGYVALLYRRATTLGGGEEADDEAARPVDDSHHSPPVCDVAHGSLTSRLPPQARS